MTDEIHVAWGYGSLDTQDCDCVKVDCGFRVLVGDCRDHTKRVAQSHSEKECPYTNRYELSRRDILTIIKLTVDQARSDWHWGESLDMGVLVHKIDRDIL